MQVKFVQASEPEYPQLCELRYQVFFQMHHLPFEILFDAQEASSLHAIISTEFQVIACGRLTPSSDFYQISQMAVAPEWQRQGLGGKIMTALVERAIAERAEVLMLQARLNAISFYQKFGFISIDSVFASTKTRLPHIKMQRLLY
jgi:predicted GNAT family N-acyltransferase